MKPSLEHLLKFTELMHAYRAVERRILVQNSDRTENDVEHSFTLAMLGWYLNSAYGLGLDSERVIMYGLAHDLVEVYAGDTYIYDTQSEHALSKQEREAEAALKLRREFPEFSDLHAAIESYEKREDRESGFIYALDKLEPILNIYLDKGRTWKKNGVTIDTILAGKTQKVSADPDIEALFHELMAKIEEQKEILF